MTPADGRRLTWSVVVVAGLTLAVLAGLWIPWNWLPGGHLVDVPASSVFTPHQIRQAEHFSGLQRTWGLLALGISLLAACGFGFTTLGARAVHRIPGPWWVQTPLAVLGLMLVGNLLTLPLSWRAQRLDREYGLSLQGWGAWFNDQALSLGVSWVSTSIGLVVLVGLVRRLPRTWPLWAGLAAAGLAFVGSFVYPVVVEPLFNSFTSMPQGQLRSDILRLAEREHVPVKDVLVADASRRTTTLNAYVSGFGGTRRIVVYDNLIKDLPQPQVEVVVAHELAHAKHRDVLVGTALGATGAVFGIGLLGLVLSDRRLWRRVGIDSAGDPRVVPLLLALSAVAMLAVSPVQNTVSRAMEAHADRTSLEVTGKTEVFIEMQRQLALRSLADPTPPRLTQLWFGTHPTTLQRIGMAEALAGR